MQIRWRRRGGHLKSVVVHSVSSQSCEAIIRHRRKGTSLTIDALQPLFPWSDGSIFPKSPRLLLLVSLLIANSKKKFMFCDTFAMIPILRTVLERPYCRVKDAMCSRNMYLQLLSALFQGNFGTYFWWVTSCQQKTPCETTS